MVRRREQRMVEGVNHGCSYGWREDKELGRQMERIVLYIKLTFEAVRVQLPI